MKKAIIILVVFMCNLTILSCQRSEDRYLKRPVTTAELIGSWVPTPFAIKCLKETGHSRHTNIADHEIEIRSDGTCHIRTVLNVMLSRPNEDSRYVDGEGRWSIKNDGHQFLYISMKTSGDRDFVSYYFDEENGQLILWQYAADPDAWKYMEFIKKNETRK
jgi:hypothetical protein